MVDLSGFALNGIYLHQVRRIPPCTSAEGRGEEGEGRERGEEGEGRERGEEGEGREGKGRERKERGEEGERREKAEKQRGKGGERGEEVYNWSNNCVCVCVCVCVCACHTHWMVLYSRCWQSAARGLHCTLDRRNRLTSFWSVVLHGKRPVVNQSSSQPRSSLVRNLFPVNCLMIWQ